LLLLPIFLIGLFPMLVFALLGFAVSASRHPADLRGLSDALTRAAISIGQIIVQGYARRSEQASVRRICIRPFRSATAMRGAGAVLIVASVCGLFYFGS